ncbi:acyl carrier protein [Nocardia sp. NPDC004278]
MRDSDVGDLLAELTEYVSTELLGPGEADGLTSSTPLVEWGVLNSIKMARLVAHIRNHLGVRIPPTEVTAANFRDLSSIAGLVGTLRSRS